MFFDAHPISGVFFCLTEIYFFSERTSLCTRRGAFLFRKKRFPGKALEYESNGKSDKTERRFFYDDSQYNTFTK